MKIVKWKRRQRSDKKIREGEGDREGEKERMME